MQGWQLVAPGEFDEVPTTQGLQAVALVSFEKGACEEDVGIIYSG